MDDPFQQRLRDLLARPVDALSVADAVEIFQVLHSPSVPATLVSQYAPRITHQLVQFSQDARAPVAALQSLSQPSTLARFFGLTIAERLPRPLAADLEGEILVGILAAVAHAAAQNEQDGRAVVNKGIVLFSSIAAGSCGPETPQWLRRALSVCSQNQAQLDSAVLPAISQNQLELLPPQLAVLFARICHEYSSAANSAWHPSACPEEKIPFLVELLQDIRTVITWALGLGSGENAPGEQRRLLETVQSTAIDSWSTWKPSLAASVHQRLKIPFEGLSEHIFAFLARTGVSSSLESLTDLFTSNDFKCISEQEFAQLGSIFSSPYILPKLRDLDSDPDDDTLSLLHFFLVFAAEHVRRSSASKQSTQFLPSVGSSSSEQLEALLIQTLKVSEPSPQLGTVLWHFEFWDAVVDHLMSSFELEEEGSIWYKRAVHCLEIALELFLPKVRYPADFETWDSDEKREFAAFRNDMEDLFLNSYSITGPRLLTRIGTIYQSLFSSQAADWKDIEATLWALQVIADPLNDDSAQFEGTTTDEILSALISPLLTSLPHAQSMSTPFRKTVLKLMTNLASFFCRQPASLELVLDLLFQLMAIPDSSSMAADSVCKLCTLAAPQLMHRFDHLMPTFVSLSTAASLDLDASMKVFGALSALAGALSTATGSLGPLYQILDFAVVERNASENAAADPSAAEQHAVVAASILCAIAKTFHASEMGPAGPDDFVTRAHQSGNNTINNNSPTTTLAAAIAADGVHDKLYQLTVSILSRFRSSAGVVEPVCGMLRAGFAETGPGPFALPAGHFLRLFDLIDPDTPAVAVAWLAAAAAFTSSREFERAGPGQPALLASLHRRHLLLSRHLRAEPDPDEDTLAAAIEVLATHARFLPTLVLARGEGDGDGDGSAAPPPPAETLPELLDFVADALVVKQLRPRSQAAQFWIKFLGLTAEQPTAQALLDAAFAPVQPKLAGTVVRRIMKNALRGEIPALARLFHALIRKNVASRGLVTAAIADALPDTRADKAQADRFVRSAYQTRSVKVVQRFWEQCLGLTGL